MPSQLYIEFEATGDAIPSQQPECRKLDENHELLIIPLVIEKPMIYLHEICSQIESATGVRISRSSVCCLIKRNGFTRKKYKL